MIETWKSVDGFEGVYEVSDLGRVRSIPRVTETKRGPWMYRGRVLKNNKGANGYAMVKLKSPGREETKYVHHLVANTFMGPTPDGLDICHNDGDAMNPALSNLRFDTRRENNLDKIRHGTDHNKRKLYCPRGHLLQEPNLQYHRRDDNHRVCLACARAQASLKVSDPEFQRISDEKYETILRTDGARGGKYKTHCDYGHELFEDNISWTKGGKYRNCKTCKSAKSSVARDPSRSFEEEAERIYATRLVARPD